MKKITADYRLIIGLIIAHMLMYFTFQDKAVFWYIFSASLLFLISHSILNEELKDEVPFGLYLLYGIGSGLLLFGIFWAGFHMIDFLNLPMMKDISKLYGRYSPSMLWHYIVLILIIIPGEEIFWRGFVQTRILKYTNIPAAIVISAILYASVHLYSEQWILAFAALVAGLFWGWLYTWKKSMPLLIVSHLIFDLFLFVIVPLK
ncbi:type II CAAX endopeptidase family protein [Bacillus sp. DTU_2020_1000418_1_SI_GHA_SEK_038]|uniref:CPBP family intramembrane glutamic endopeptidase n=1 Tax=Bacillus sp. DTU_2020_1000418_1_SI_GHA_SEK_038 TaxID=3077585 RepID=UPI0028E49DD2|nr:type II CAAX endopeptidase family protein [Bacillus sp. DTU_2020_1000418_1_SI_GHA_SEK_038]WNS76973.1 type II CAAX endopeptidase family protein [Bacillus sp. DTU_2020_1000418_1_SI_GHA_SEK_038]